MDIQRSKFKKTIVIDGRNRNIFNRTKCDLAAFFQNN